MVQLNNLVGSFMFFNNNCVFYSNLKDNYKLYLKRNDISKKVSDVKAKNIVGNKEKVYYTDNIEGRIYEIDYNGENEKIIYEPYPYEVEYIENNIEKISWIPIHKDDKKRELIIDSYHLSNTLMSELSLWKNYLLFRQGDKLKLFDLNTGGSRDVFQYGLNTPSPYNVIIYKDNIYYINDQDYKLYVMNCNQLLSDKPKIELVIEKEVVGFYINNGKIYFYDWEGAAYEYCILSKEILKIVESGVNLICVIKDNIFYRNASNGNRIYVYNDISKESYCLSSGNIKDMVCYDGKLYFYDEDNVLYKYDNFEIDVL